MWAQYEDYRLQQQARREARRAADDVQEMARLAYLRVPAAAAPDEPTVTFEGRDCDSLLPTSTPACDGKADVLLMDEIEPGSGCCMNGRCYSGGPEGSLARALLAARNDTRDPITRQEIAGLSRAVALRRCPAQRPPAPRPPGFFTRIFGRLWS